MLAQGSPQADTPTLVVAITPVSSAPLAGALPAEALAAEGAEPGAIELETEATNRQQPAPGRVVAEYPGIKPLAPQRFALQFTIGQSAHDKETRQAATFCADIPDAPLEERVRRAPPFFHPGHAVSAGD